MRECRRKIVLDFAKWTALSALRSGAPIKKRGDVYPLLDMVAFEDLLQPNRLIADREFDEWHKKATLALCKGAKPCSVPVGWSAKLLNVYLKTAVYVGDLGHESLRLLIHPPLDAGLWAGIKERFANQPEIVKEVCCTRRIKDIESYETYSRIINGCRKAAVELGCSLIEVEQLWQGSATPEAP